MKVLHILETSFPHVVGYTIRARAIIDNQRRLGLDPVVVTSPFFKAQNPRTAVEQLNGTTYYRTNHIPAPSANRSKLSSYAVRALMMSRYRRAVLDVVLKERPDVIHAHSSYGNAYAGLPAARRMGLPLLYEVRTLWGESAVIEDGWKRNSWKHRLIWRFELGAMQRADLVIPISRGIRDELILRGISADKLEVVPNGVDTALFPPTLRDASLAARVGVSGKFVIGFVGSILKIEGLPTLLDAYRICRAQRDDVALVIVGDGAERKRLEAEAVRLGISDAVFAGRVPPDDVRAWYSIMDVLVYPRIRAVVNERVTPLKPLEAMALQKVCIGSDVGGLKELIRHDDTGIIFRSEDPGDLANSLLALMTNPQQADRIKRAALTFVKQEREWSTIVGRYIDLYAKQIARKNANGKRSGSRDYTTHAELQ